jgi:hypothetical protein
VLLPSATSRRLLPSTSTSSSSKGVVNSNILALQQRLLLPQPGVSGLFGGSEREGGSGRSPLLGGQSAVAAGPAAGLQQAAQLRGPRMAGQQAASVPGASLHARMASTAARAQLLLCRELTSLTPPLAPRTRPAAAAAVCNDTYSAAPVVDAAASSQAAAAASMQQQQLQPGELPGGSSLRFVTVSRPSSAAKGKCSNSGFVPAGAPSSLLALQVAAAVLDSPGSILAGSTATSTSGSGAGDSTAAGCAAFSRRPLSAGVAVRWGSSSGSEGGSSGRPSTSGSASIPGEPAG